MTIRKNAISSDQYHTFEKQAILSKLRDSGFRITKQRELILDVILEGSCTCSKEIYACARAKDSSVGSATVYRMVNLLEEIGVINRRNLYRLPEMSISQGVGSDLFCSVTLSDQTTLQFTSREWADIVRAGLKHCGLLTDQTVSGISIQSLPSH